MVKNGLLLFGGIFVVVGILGFVLGSPLFGIFAVDTLHNIIHLVSGLVFLVVALFLADSAKMTAKIFGIVYAIVALLGLVVPGDMIFGLIHANLWDDLLHVALSAALLYIGFSGSSESKVHVEPAVDAL